MIKNYDTLLREMAAEIKEHCEIEECFTVEEDDVSEWVTHMCPFWKFDGDGIDYGECVLGSPKYWRL